METDLRSEHETTAAHIGGSGQGSWPLTSWSLLRRAAGKDADAEALATLAKRYEGPILAYFSAMTRNRDEAEELAQEFWSKKILAGPLLRSADRNKQQFRVFLKAAARNHRIDRIRVNKAGSRDPANVVSLDATPDPDSLAFDAPGPETPEDIIDRVRTAELMAEALRLVSNFCQRKGQSTHWQIFHAMYLSEAADDANYRDLGAPHGLDEKAARERVQTVLRHLRKALRRLVFQDAGEDVSRDRELAELRASLKG